jgi:hypothetical protein
MLPIHHDTFVHSYDAPGDCLAALSRALAEGSPYPAERVHVLRVGERQPLAGSPLGVGAQAWSAPPLEPANAQGAP